PVTQASPTVPVWRPKRLLAIGGVGAVGAAIAAALFLGSGSRAPTRDDRPAPATAAPTASAPPATPAPAPPPAPPPAPAPPPPAPAPPGGPAPEGRPAGAARGRARHEPARGGALAEALFLLPLPSREAARRRGGPRRPGDRTDRRSPARLAPRPGGAAAEA